MNRGHGGPLEGVVVDLTPRPAAPAGTDDLMLAAEFPAVTRDAWAALVDDVVRRLQQWESFEW